MNVDKNELLEEIKSHLKINIRIIGIPPQGMDSQVFTIADENNKEYIVKVTKYINPESEIYVLLEEKKVNIPYPKVLANFEYNGGTVLILEKISKPLLDSVPVEDMAPYISSMIEVMRELHKVKSDIPGKPVNQVSGSTWKTELLSTFEGDLIDWKDVYKRELLDGDLVKTSVEKFIERTNQMTFLDRDFSLLHTDFNQRNLFVDTSTKKIGGIIDWSGAIFGDPIYDFARIRMYIWHFDLGQESIKEYYELMDYTDNQKKLDDYYWLFRVIEYLAWYSEEENEFNLGRIKLHQDFLRNYQW